MGVPGSTTAMEVVVVVRTKALSTISVNHRLCFRTSKHVVTLPSELASCTNCTLRLIRQALNWGQRYLFWSCADVTIVPGLSRSKSSVWDSFHWGWQAIRCWGQASMRTSSVNFRGEAKHFCPKNMYEKLRKCPNFTWFLPEKLSKYPNFCDICPKN